MPPSQLKQLKAAIHERRTGSSNGRGTVSARKPQTQSKRPKSFSEETRRRTLLPEMQRRHKVGGIVDRRIGENDPTMTPDDRMLQRYVKQRSKRESIFNLEDVEDDNTAEDVLTHFGERLSQGAADIVGEELEEDEDIESRERAKKRRRLSGEASEEEDAAYVHPDRRKTRKEVMEEVIAKSKLHKYERQKEREEDQDVREQLDRDLPNLLAALRGQPAPGRQKEEAFDRPESSREKDYDKSIRELAAEQKAKPTERTKTAEERAEAEAARLKALEEERQRRMSGEAAGTESDADGESVQEHPDLDVGIDEASAFGLKSTEAMERPLLDADDEDDFIIDDDLVASGSDVELVLDDQSSEENDQLDDDDEFLKDVLPSEQVNGRQASVPAGSNEISYTYPCPQSHAQLLEVVKSIPFGELPTVVQRIRALYHPQLHAKNKERLSNFAAALVDHLHHLAQERAPHSVVEAIIRHIHSLSKSYTEVVAEQLRKHLQNIHKRQDIVPGDLFILSAIGSIYPTSDHFHQVVTPAMTIMARWLGLTTSPTASQLDLGAFLVALCLKFQRLSKRYVPEAVRFTIRAINQSATSPAQNAHVANLLNMAELWSDKSAFIDIFSPSALAALEATKNKAAIQRLTIMLEQAQLRRRNLELHHHRPLAIKTSIPKFEENFNPDKHYDPDRERSEAKKLKAEYKREKKGALRELRKDASFIAREKLRAKKEADATYAEKQRKLIAEIQSTEGAQKNEYERERRRRKGRQ